MGFSNLYEDSELDVADIISLASTQGLKYKKLSGGKVRIFEINPSDGKTFSAGVSAGEVGGWLGWAKGGTKVTKDFRKTGMFYNNKKRK